MKQAMTVIEAERDALAEGVRKSLEELEISHAHEAAQETTMAHEHEMNEAARMEIQTLQETIRSLEEKLSSTTAITNNDEDIDAMRQSYEREAAMANEQIASMKEVG